MTPPTHRRQEGATLIVTVLTMTVLIAVLLAVSTQLTLSSRSSSVDRRDALQAQYAAESGLAATTTYLRDIQSVFNGIRNADGTRTPILVVPKSLTADTLLNLATSYCGATWTQTSAASVYPVKYRCDAAATSDNENAARYEVLARFANINLLPATLVATKTGGIKSTSDLQAYWKDVFSPNGVTISPTGSTYTVKYSLKPVRVEREGNTNFKFYLQVNEVRSNGTSGKAERVILANATSQSEIWFQITLPTFVDRVLFTNYHRTRSNTNKRPNFTDQTFDGPVHTNDRFTFADGATANFKSKVTSAGCYAFNSDGTCGTNTDGSYKQQPGLYVSDTLSTLNNPLSGLVGNTSTLNGLTSKVPGGVNFTTAPDWQADYQPMPENAEDQKGAAETAGLTIPDGATVTMAASTSSTSVVSPTSYSTNDKKWSPAATYQFITVASGGVSTIYRLDSSGKLEEKVSGGWATKRSAFNGVLYSPGSINVAGPGRNSSNQSLPALAPFAQMTVAAEKNVGIVNDLSYSDIPCKGTESCTSKATPFSTGHL